jgi:flavin reductase ActVB
MTATATQVSAGSFRHAMRQLASGVTVVTATRGDGSRVGLTASSFVPVSADPPLVLVCIDRAGSSFPVFAQCTRFAVSVLADDQVDVARRFSTPRIDRFAGGRLMTTDDGLPVVDGALSVVECEPAGRHLAGDHLILLGRVYRLRSAPGRPMVYFDRDFRSLAPGPARRECDQPSRDDRAWAS